MTSALLQGLIKIKIERQLIHEEQFSVKILHVFNATNIEILLFTFQIAFVDQFLVFFFVRLVNSVIITEIDEIHC